MNETLLETFVIGAVSAAIFAGSPVLYRLGKKKKATAKEKGKVYYGLAGYRIILLCLLGIISAEIPLGLILGDNLSGIPALLLVLLLAAPISFLYIIWYTKRAEKKLSKHHNKEEK